MTKYPDQDVEKNITETEIDNQNNQEDLSKIDWSIDDFKADFEKSNLAIKFDKVFLLNSPVDGQADANTVTINDLAVDDILNAYQKSPIYIFKRSFWK